MAGIEFCDPKYQACSGELAPEPSAPKESKSSETNATSEASRPKTVDLSSSRAQLDKVRTGRTELEKIEFNQKKVHQLAKKGKEKEAKAEYEKIVQRYEKLPLSSNIETQSEWVKNILAGSAKDTKSSTMRTQAALTTLGFRKNLGIYGINGIDGKKGYFTRRALKAYQASKGIKDPGEVEEKLIADARKILGIQVASESKPARTAAPHAKAHQAAAKKTSHGLKSLEKTRPVSLNSKVSGATPRSQFDAFVHKYNETLQTGRDAMKFDHKTPEFVSSRQKFVRQVDVTVAAAKHLGMSKEKVSQLVKDLFKPLVKEEAAAINPRSKEQKRELANHYGLQSIARNLTLEIKRDEPGNRWIREQVQMRRSYVAQVISKTS